MKDLDVNLKEFEKTYKSAFIEYDVRVHKDCINNDHLKCGFGS